MPESCQIFTLRRTFVSDDLSHAVRVLVVDDYQDTADAIAMLLELDGFEVRVAYHGTSAIEVAHGWQPQIVPLNICMPDVSGLDVASNLRASEATLNAVLIGHSALISSADIGEARKKGFDAYCSKPTDLTTLSTMLARFVKIAH